MDLSELSTESDESGGEQQQFHAEMHTDEEGDAFSPPLPHPMVSRRTAGLEQSDLRSRTAPVSITRKSLPNIQSGPTRHTRHGSLTNSFYKTPYERCLPSPVSLSLGLEDSSPAFPSESGLPTPDFSSFDSTFSLRRPSSPMVTPEAPKKTRRGPFSGRTYSSGARVSDDSFSASEESEDGDGGVDLEIDFTKPIGEGSQGHVYRAFDRKEEKWYAVKILKHEGRRAKIQREIGFVQHFSPHPHLLSYLGEWERGGQIFLKMVLGVESLADYTNKWQKDHCAPGNGITYIPEEQLMRFFTDVALGLDRIHQAGYVHRDIKPNNIVFDALGNLLIGDFGLLLPEGEVDSREGDSRYLAREAIRMDITHRSLDIFSMGATFLELSSLLQMPQDGTLWEQLREGQIEELRIFPLIYSSDYRQLICSMMHPIPEERPTTTQILAHPRVRAEITKRFSSLRARSHPYLRALQAQVNTVPRCPRARSRSFPRKSLTKRSLFPSEDQCE